MVGNFLRHSEQRYAVEEEEEEEEKEEEDEEEVKEEEEEEEAAAVQCVSNRQCYSFRYRRCNG